MPCPSPSGCSGRRQGLQATTRGRSQPGDVDPETLRRLDLAQPAQHAVDGAADEVMEELLQLELLSVDAHLDGVADTLGSDAPPALARSSPLSHGATGAPAKGCRWGSWSGGSRSGAAGPRGTARRRSLRGRPS